MSSVANSLSLQAGCSLRISSRRRADLGESGARLDPPQSLPRQGECVAQRGRSLLGWLGLSVASSRRAASASSCGGVAIAGHSWSRDALLALLHLFAPRRPTSCEPCQAHAMVLSASAVDTHGRNAAAWCESLPSARESCVMCQWRELFPGGAGISCDRFRRSVDTAPAAAQRERAVR